MEKVYYSAGGYWKGIGAVGRLSEAARVGKDVAKGWLEKQSIYQIYLPPPKYIPRPNSSMSLQAKPNSIHQTDLLFLPRDVYRGKAYKYLLCVVDVASRYKGVYPLTSKSSAGVANGFVSIYKNTPLKFPDLLVCDAGKEFYGEVSKIMKENGVDIQRGDPSQHRSQGIVERFNRTLSERLFSYQYHKEMLDTSKSNREWVSRVQGVVDALNGEVTRLIKMKPKDAIKLEKVTQGFSSPLDLSKTTKTDILKVGCRVRYLYEGGELEGWVYKKGKGGIGQLILCGVLMCLVLVRLFLVDLVSLICII